MIVSDSGPLIGFARIGRLDLFEHVYGEVVIPDAVNEEVVIRGRGRPGATEVRQSSWITRIAVSNPAALDQLPQDIHPGEREAIVLAQELGVLIDERRGRRAANRQGVPVVGSLQVFAQAKRRGIVSKVSPLVDVMLASGYWIDDDLVKAFLDRMGEADGPSP